MVAACKLSPQPIRYRRASAPLAEPEPLTSLLNVVMTDIAVAMMRVIVIMAAVMIVRVVVLS